MNRDTWLAHAGLDADPITGAMVPPLHAATTFRRDDQYRLPSEFVYARYSHPLAVQAESTLAELEGGHAAALFGSGMAAFSALLETVERGAVVAAPKVMYHGGRDLLLRLSDRLDVRFFDPLDDHSLQTALAGGARLVWIETLANPTWDVIDVEHIAARAHAAGAVVAVDSTVTPPVTFRAIDHGADWVFHSATKFLNGHSDVTAGVLVAAHEGAAWDELLTTRKLAGSILAPFETWLLVRGLRTLHLRWERSTANAQAIAEHLQRHPGIERVLYPGLPNHPGHELATRQFSSGPGSMLSALVAGSADDAVVVASRLQIIRPATSLGGVESLVEHRATVEGPHSSVAGNLLRFSIGIEHVDDLLADLDQALS